MLFSSPMRLWLCLPFPRDRLVTCRATAAPTPRPQHNTCPLSQLCSLPHTPHLLVCTTPSELPDAVGLPRLLKAGQAIPEKPSMSPPQNSHCCQSFALQAYPPALAAERRMEKGN